MLSSILAMSIPNPFRVALPLCCRDLPITAGRVHSYQVDSQVCCPACSIIPRALHVFLPRYMFTAPTDGDISDLDDRNGSDKLESILLMFCVWKTMDMISSRSICFHPWLPPPSSMGRRKSSKFHPLLPSTQFRTAFETPRALLHA